MADEISIWLPSIRHLRMFVIIALSNSVTRAAQLCHVSQPAVTQAITKMERATGPALFHRSPQGLFATDAGAVLHYRADRALAMLDAAMADLDQGIRVRATWPQLSALIAVTETESFTLAARRLGVAQPTVHRATTMLEQAAGTAFIQRTAHGLIITRAGAQLAQAGRLALAEMEQARADLGALDGREVGRITIGALPLSRSSWLPRAILAFRRQRPGLPVQIIDGRYDELLLSLRRGEIDFVLGALRLPSPIEDVEQERLFDDEAVIVARRDHPLAATPNPTRAQLLSYPWVMPRRSTPLRAILDGFIGPDGAADLVETSSVIMQREILRLGDHIGGLSRLQAQVESATLTILPVRLDGAMRAIGVTTRKGWEPTQAQRDFLVLLRRTAVQLTD